MLLNTQNVSCKVPQKKKVPPFLSDNLPERNPMEGDAFDFFFFWFHIVMESGLMTEKQRLLQGFLCHDLHPRIMTVAPEQSATNGTAPAAALAPVQPQQSERGFG